MRSTKGINTRNNYDLTKTEETASKLFLLSLPLFLLHPYVTYSPGARPDPEELGFDR